MRETRSYRAERAGKVGGEVVLELARFQQLGLDEVVEAELPDGDEDGPGGRPVGSGEELAEALLARHPHQAVDSMLVAGKEMWMSIQCFDQYRKYNANQIILYTSIKNRTACNRIVTRYYVMLLL